VPLMSVMLHLSGSGRRSPGENRIRIYFYIISVLSGGSIE
jgi:hypothetical protein